MQLNWHDFIQVDIKFYPDINLIMEHHMVQCLPAVIHARLAADAQQAPNFVHFDIPYKYRWEYGEENLLKESVTNLERVIAFEGPQNIAAILLEGESGSSGCLKYPVGYLKKVREICDKHGILFIMDEVMSGFGRTGKWFGFQHHDIVPDMIAMAKGLPAGYLPLGALMVSEKIAAKYDDDVFRWDLLIQHILLVLLQFGSIENL